MRKKEVRKFRGLLLRWIMIASLVVGLIAPGLGNASEQAFAASMVPAPITGSFSDLSGHWAEKTVREWAGQGLIEGFEDGTFKPNQALSRIEYVTLVNRLFVFKGAGDSQFTDVAPTAWYAAQVQAASGAGYIQGYADGTFRPNQKLSRVEAAVVLSRLVPVIGKEGEERLSGFKDQASVPSYGRNPLEAIIEAGYMSGLTDGTIRPLQPMTRAEAVSMLDRVLKQSTRSEDGLIARAKILETGGTWGPSQGNLEIAGDVIIQAPGTTLRNVTIKGSLTIGKDVGEGDVFLKGVKVLGTTLINGGGEHSIHIDDSQLGSVVVEKIDGQVRVVVGGTTVISQMDVQTAAIIESSITEDSGIKGISISASGDVILSGKFSQVEVKSDVQLTVASGSIAKLTVVGQVNGSTITLAEGVSITNMELHGAASVKGKGTIENALVDSPGVTFEKEPIHKEVTDKGGLSGGAAGGTGSPGGPTGPTDPTSPTDPVDIAVTATAGQAGVMGFRLAFSTPVPGLAVTNLTLKNSTNSSIAVTSVATLSGGSSYFISAALTEGESYTLTITKTGFRFGDDIGFQFPLTEQPTVSVTASVYGTSAAGFSLSLSPAVAHLANAAFTLKHGNESVAILAITEGAEGSSYAFEAALTEGETYSLSVVQSGYDFGGAVPVFIPITDPEVIPVNASVSVVSAAGFMITLDTPVTDLTETNLTLVDAVGAVIGLTDVIAENGGTTYAVKADLLEGETYTLTIRRTGYSFGAALAVTVAPRGNISVHAAVSRISTAGFMLELDRAVPGIDALSFVLKDDAGSDVGINMLSAVSVGKEFEVYSSLTKGESYSLSLDVEGYEFNGEVVLKVEPSSILSNVDWVNRQAFQLNFPNDVVDLAHALITIEDEEGKPLAVSSVQTNADGRSATISAKFTETGSYRYRIDVDDDRYTVGTLVIPEKITVEKQTVYEQSNKGIIVHFSVPVPGLTTDAFYLANTSGVPIVIDNVSTSDNGSSYFVESAAMQYQPVTLKVSSEGYDFGDTASIVRTTINPWYSGVGPNNVMVGLNPNLTDMTANHFKVVDASGNAVAITNVLWDPQQRFYIVSYNGLRGKPYFISVKREGYDFGVRKSVTLAEKNTITDISYAGFTFVLNPPAIIDPTHGFVLKRADGSNVTLRSVLTSDGGWSYRIDANLAPGDYVMKVSATMDQTIYNIHVPVVTTISADQVVDKGLRVKLSYAIAGLLPGQFLLTRKSTGEQVTVQDAVTTDGGLTYRLKADLPGGSYNLSLSGHLPAQGIEFEAGETIDAGQTTISNTAMSGFDLVFEQAVPGLLPAHIQLTDNQGNPVTGLALTTTNGGLSYHVSVNLISGRDYTIAFLKDYAKFSGPVTFYVNQFVTGIITDVSKDGAISVTFSTPLRQMEYGQGLAVKDEQGNRYHPGTLAMSADGKSFEMSFGGTFALTRGQTYVFDIELEGYSFSHLAFKVPSAATVTRSSVAGVTVHFDTPVPGLGKQNFVIRGAQGEIITVASAVTTDSGSSYVLGAALTASKAYTVLVKPDLTYQRFEPVSFVLTKLITASVSEMKKDSFKLSFSEKVTDLKPAEIILRGPDGQQIPFTEYSLSTKDQGLTYTVVVSSIFSAKYLLELKRNEFMLAAPVKVDTPAVGSVRLIGTTAAKMVVDVYPIITDMTGDNFKLTDSKGQPVGFTLQYEGGASYSLNGNFNVSETYSLVVSYPGYDFGYPLSVGLKVRVDAVLIRQSQQGFTVYFFPSVPDLQLADVKVKDNNGNTLAIQSIQTNDEGASYTVTVPLKGGMTYTASVDKEGYQFSTLDKITLNSRSIASVQASVSQVTLHFAEQTMLSTSDIHLFDENGAKIAIRTNVSHDGGYSYELGATLVPDKVYSVLISKMGYDYGDPLSFSIRSIGISFGGMISGNNQAFILNLNQAVPHLRLSDFQLKRADGGKKAITTATTSDGGNSYLIEAEFWGAEQYTIVPTKAGYDFGKPIVVDVPIIANAAVLSSGASEIVIGLSPAVSDLDAGHVVITDEDGNQLTAASVVSDDNGLTYRIKASYQGGKTYSFALSKAGYDFGQKLSALLPSAMIGTVESATETGLVVSFAPGLSGLTLGSFALKDSQGGLVVIKTATTHNGGRTYTLSAALEGGKTYKLTMMAGGYDFGAALSAFVPVPINPSITEVSKEGFEVQLDSAVPGLNISDFSLRNSQGVVVTIVSATAVNDGNQYAVHALLQDGAAYSLTLMKSGYAFGSGLPILVPAAPVPEAQVPIQLAAAQITTNGFTLELSKVIANLDRAWLTLQDDQGRVIGFQLTNPNSNNANAPNAGRIYNIIAPLSAGVKYKLIVQIPERVVVGPLDVYVPITEYPRSLAATRSGLKVTFVGAGPKDLQPEDITLLSEDGTEFAVTGVVAGEEAGSFLINANVAEGKKYTVSFSKQGYIFEGQANLKGVYVPFFITVSFVRVNENGFNLVLSAPVPNLNIEMHNGTAVWYRPTSSSTPDFGQTYSITEYIGYNKEFKLRLSKDGYDLGPEMIISNVSTPPELVEAVSSENGKAITLTFDKPLAAVNSGSTFSVKINNQWQSGVMTRLTADATKIELTWSSSGAVISSTSTVAIAYSGNNRVKAVNQTFLATFGEYQVANVATLEGFLQSYSSQYDAVYPVHVLRIDYGKTALESLRLLRQAGFTVANYAKAVKSEYGLAWSEFIRLFYEISADAPTLFQALSGSGYNASYVLLIPDFISAGYEAEDIALPLRNKGYQTRELVAPFKVAGVTADAVAYVLRYTYAEQAASATAALKLGKYSLSEIRKAIQFIYGLSNASTVEAIAAAKFTAVETAVVIKDAYAANSVDNAKLLGGAGYPANEIGVALRDLYSFSDANEAVQTYLGAGFDAAQAYAILRSSFGKQETAKAMLEEDVSTAEVAKGIQASGDGAAVFVGAMKSGGYENVDIASALLSAWGSEVAGLIEAMKGFADHGYDMESRAQLLRQGFGAELSTTISVLYPAVSGAQRKTMLLSLIHAGYDPAELTAYFLNNRLASSRSEALTLLRQSGMSTAQGLSTIRNAAIRGGSSFTLEDAVEVIYRSYDRFEAVDVLNALRSAFAGDETVSVDATTMARSLTSIKSWEKLVIGQALKAQLGLTLQQWVELERTSAFDYFKCPCQVSTVVKDSQYLFPGTSIQEVTVAMSLSSLYTLGDIIEGTINLYPTGGVRANGLPYLTAALKNSGYTFVEIAEAFEVRGWSEWIGAFSRQGIAASEVAAYFKQTALPPTIGQMITRLAPYPIRDIALVLRTEYGLESSEASTLLLSAYTPEEVSSAIASAYGGDPMTIWIKVLKEQGATAISVINTLGALYPSYFDSGKVGPALIKGGYTKEEVMEGLLIHTRRLGNLKTTIGILQALYGQEQVTIAELLDASSSKEPKDGIAFLRTSGYSLAVVANSLKDYYHLTSSEASFLLAKEYPNDIDNILLGLASLYGQGLDETVAGALEQQGITTIGAAVHYLYAAGFPVKDIVSVAKGHFNQSAGEIALRLSTVYLSSSHVLIQAVASVYGQSAELTMYQRQAAEGTASFPIGIELAYKAQFSLVSMVRMAKDGYGISSGAALQALMNTGRYRQSDVVSAVSTIYGSSQNASIIDALEVQHLVTFVDAVPYLRKMRFSLRDMIQVGKDYYHLDSSQTVLALKDHAVEEESRILAEVSAVYGLTLEQVTIQAMIDLGIGQLSDAIPQLRLTYSLRDIIRIAKDYYRMTAGETLGVLSETNVYSFNELVATVYEVYGKPIDESLSSLLKRNQINTLEAAVPFLRGMGYTLNDIVGAAKDYFGFGAEKTLGVLNALQADNEKVIEVTVAAVYGQSSESTTLQRLEEGGIKDASAAIPYLWESGVPMMEIVRVLKEFYGKTAGEAATLLINSQLFGLDVILNSVITVYGQSVNGSLIEAIKASGVTSAGAMAELLLHAGYRMEDIAKASKEQYGKTREETLAILQGLSAYQETAIQLALSKVYEEAVTPVTIIKDVLKLKGVTTAQGAVVFLKEAGYEVKEIVQYLRFDYKLDSGAVTELLSPYFKSEAIGLAIVAVYYTNTNLRVLEDIFPATTAFVPLNVVRFMKDKFTVADIVLAMKLLFQLDAAAVMELIPGTLIPQDKVRIAVGEVFGGNPLLTYLARMKANGTDVIGITTELERQNLLGPDQSGYLTDTLLTLGFDRSSIIRAFYMFFTSGRGTGTTVEEQSTMFVKLGYTQAGDIIDVLKQNGYVNSTSYAYRILTTVKLALPNVSLVEVAKAMKSRGYAGRDILNVLNQYNVREDAILDLLKEYGYNAVEALSFMRGRTLEDQLYWVHKNGYSVREYLRYTFNWDNNAISILKQLGVSSSDMAIALNSYGNSLYYISKYLYDGGFTEIEELTRALLATNARVQWIPYNLLELGHWSLKEIAKGMLDSGLITLVELSSAIRMANSNNLAETYLIIKEISTREQQAFYDSLSSVERKLLSNNEIAVIVTITTLRSDNVKIAEVTKLLRSTEREDYKKAIILMALSGYNVFDALDAVWDVYRFEIGIDILKTMIGQTCTKVLTEFKDYYRLGNLIYRIVTNVAK
ncbi:S-layer homology domain-containing protein [Paenibacillus luteus]|uniref:S-layer homology domain-containing protein n=1 Tax=Paenibacillus luteus TaxID=2545753 RepID=UPI0019D4F3EE|nr:S-layer homology domain-containing protein [Paenibacillus luteus]